MDSETNSPGPTPSESKREDTLRREIVKNLAESLVQSRGLLALSNELERKGIPNQLHPEMSEEEASKVLLDLVENHNLLNSETSLSEVMKLPPNERGAWALDQVEQNLSNEDS